MSKDTKVFGLIGLVTIVILMKAGTSLMSEIEKINALEDQLVVTTGSRFHHRLAMHQKMHSRKKVGFRYD